MSAGSFCCRTEGRFHRAPGQGDSYTRPQAHSVHRHKVLPACLSWRHREHSRELSPKPCPHGACILLRDGQEAGRQKIQDARWGQQKEENEEDGGQGGHCLSLWSGRPLR